MFYTAAKEKSYTRNILCFGHSRTLNTNSTSNWPYKTHNIIGKILYSVLSLYFIQINFRNIIAWRASEVHTVRYAFQNIRFDSINKTIIILINIHFGKNTQKFKEFAK